MSATENQERRGDKKSSLVERLHDPTQLRVVLMGTVLAIGYGAIYMPLDKNIAETTRKLHDCQKRLILAGEVDHLRKQYRQVEKRIPQQADWIEWMQYVENRIRQSHIRLESLNPGPQQNLGTYQVVTLKIRLFGSFADLDKFLCWLESNDRLFRVDTVDMSPGTGDSGGDIGMDLTILGLMG